MKPTKKTIYAILPNVIVPLAGMSTDIYLPSMPSMVEVFHVTKSHVQLSLSTYVFGMAIAQLLAGPLSDSVGRKKMILFALLAQMLAVIGIVSTPSMNILIFIRLLQGLGAGFMIVPARAILNDCFQGIDLKKKFNYLTISFALAPVIAPFIGGYCEQLFGYQASFIFIFIYALILLLIVSLSMDETLNTKHPFSFVSMINRYKTILGHKNYLMGTLFVSLLFGYATVFSALGPFIYQNKLNFSPVEYGYIALLIGLAWFSGNLSNRFMLGIPENRKITSCLWIKFVALITFLVSAYMGFYNSILTTALVFLVVYLTGIIFPNIVSHCLTLFPDMSASANACFFSFLWIAFTFYTLCATQISIHTLLPLSLLYLLIHFLSRLFYRQFNHQNNELSHKLK